MQGALWHVTRLSRVAEYQRLGMIIAPVRAWKTIEAAQNFSMLTGRRVILRLADNGTFVPLEGHGGLAMISHVSYDMTGINLLNG